jgi:hypothetical protein
MDLEGFTIREPTAPAPGLGSLAHPALDLGAVVSHLAPVAHERIDLAVDRAGDASTR